ncbi:MAG TPA: acido-empty-quinoprotein group A [Terriglobales bacterium]
MKRRVLLMLLGLALAAASQGPGLGLTPAALLRPGTGWPTYNGDYSGQRYSALHQITAANVHELALAWVSHPAARGARGESFASTSKATPLEVNGTLYFSAPDVAWAIDARTGRERWHYLYPPNDGHRNGSRGLGMLGNWLYLVTPDNHLVCLDARTGKPRWTVEIADVKLDYFSTTAPVIVKNHVIVGVGGDTLDNPAYIESRDPDTGELQWQFFTEPRPGQPGSETWPSADAMEHGGGMPWIPGTYDPALNLYYFGTGNPNPVYDGRSRVGDDLWTCSIVALNPDTGKMAWYFQASPHDTHDWDAVETPVLFNATVAGRPRKLLAQASRNGYFFVLDRTNGHHLVTAPFITTNWTRGIRPTGQPQPNPAKEPAPQGTLVVPAEGGGTNWHPPAYDPAAGLFYVNATQEYSIDYRTALGKGEGYAGRGEPVGGGQEFTLALAAADGHIAWRHNGGVGGLLATAGGVLFTGNGDGDLLALDPATGKTLWHTQAGATLGNGPMTYELDGRQYVVFGVGDALFAFYLPQA